MMHIKDEKDQMIEEKEWIYVKEEHSELYKKFRPMHPDSIFTLIKSKLQQSMQALSPSLQQKHVRNSEGRWPLALDVGCGTGLSTLPLLSFVQKIYAIDRSHTQIQQAIAEYGNRDASRVIFQQADVSEVKNTYESASFDLITVGLAAHWMKRDQIATAALQLLRPGGLLVLYSVKLPVMHDEKAFKIISQFMRDFLLVWMEHDGRLAMHGYHEIQEEIQQFFPVIERDETISSELEQSVEEFRGHMASTASYQKFLQQKKEGEVDPLDQCIQNLKAVYQDGNKFKISYPIVILFAQKPEC